MYNTALMYSNLYYNTLPYTSYTRNWDVYFVILYTQYGSYFTFHYSSLAFKNPACRRSSSFFVIIDKLFDLPACCSRQNGSYRGISPHPSTKPPWNSKVIFKSRHSFANSFYSVIGVSAVIFLRRWRTICTILQPIGSNGRYLKKCPKPYWPISIKETWTGKLALTGRNTLFAL